jgi:hypothetical protein
LVIPSSRLLWAPNRTTRLCARGQIDRLTLKWPVLQHGGVPYVDLNTWDFRISGLVEKPARLNWQEFRSLPHSEIQCDIHCVTRWSRFDNRFEGVLFAEVIKLVTPRAEAKFQKTSRNSIAEKPIECCAARRDLRETILTPTGNFCGLSSDSSSKRI